MSSMKASMHKFSTWIKCTDERYLKKIFEDLLIKSGFNIIGFMDKQFDPFGYTCLWLLSESHFAIHTFPEHNKTYIELSSCNKKFYDTFIKYRKEALKYESIRHRQEE